jgi:hypothetical protein
MPGEPSAHIALNIAKKRFEAAKAKATSGEGREVNGAFEDICVAEMDDDDRLQAEGADDEALEAEDGGRGRENMDEEEDNAPASGSGGGITPMDARLGSWSNRTARVSLYGSVGVRVPAEPGSGGWRDTIEPFDAEWGRKGSCGGLARECGFGESKGRGAL